MKPVTVVQGTGVPLNRSNIDTDQIIPSDWLKQIERTGFDRGLFSEWRDEPDFILNNPDYSGAKVLIAGENFGIGSSREHAVWAILQYGFEAVISSCFGDIFKNNSTKNGLVPVVLPETKVQELIGLVTKSPSIEITIDVENTLVNVPQVDFEATFDLTNDVQKRLLLGLDDIGISLKKADSIAGFESNRPSWLS